MNKLIPVFEPSITQKEIDYVTSAVKSGWVSSIGEYINKFETAFAQFVGVKHALAVSNGTTALHLALVSLGIKAGDEVIVPDLTFVSTANAVAYTGAKPVMVDVDSDTWCIDPVSIEKAVTGKTKAIIPVHLYGHPANMDEVNAIAQHHDLYVIEDAAEAHGAEYKNKKTGSIGDVGCFSFYGNKIITTGEGGMITTNDRAFYEKARFLCDQAMSKEKKYWHPEIGYNYRMTNLQAALGLAQLERIGELIEKKIQVFKWYSEFLGGIEGIRLNSQKEWAKNVYWMICLVLEKDFGVARNIFMAKLKAVGIDSRPFFYPMSELPMYGSKCINPIAYRLSQEGLNLPSSANLTRDQVLFICRQVKEILKVRV